MRQDAVERTVSEYVEHADAAASLTPQEVEHRLGVAGFPPTLGEATEQTQRAIAIHARRLRVTPEAAFHIVREEERRAITSGASQTTDDVVAAVRTH